MSNFSFQFTRAYGDPVATGQFKERPEDFKVVETLSFSPIGEGDHLYLYIRKTSANTDWVAGQLAKLANLKSVDVGYAGLKDRDAVTEQWFSLHMPNQPEPNWENLPDNIEILSKTRHTKKLRTGAIKHNQFIIHIRRLHCDQEKLINRLNTILEYGIPNYFGPQRFGRNKSNVQQFLEMAKANKRVKRHQRSMLISAARSYLFNHILSRRVSLNTWNKIIDGDVLMLDGSRSIFIPECIDSQLNDRLDQLKVHPCAILWGEGKQMISGNAADLMDEVILENAQLTVGLKKFNASLAHRAMRLSVKNFDWQIEGDVLKLSFCLASGSFATSVLTEFLNTDY